VEGRRSVYIDKRLLLDVYGSGTVAQVVCSRSRARIERSSKRPKKTICERGRPEQHRHLLRTMGRQRDRSPRRRRRPQQSPRPARVRPTVPASAICHHPADADGTARNRLQHRALGFLFPELFSPSFFPHLLISHRGGFWGLGTLSDAAVLAGRADVGFPVTLHRSCPRLCACPVLAAGDGLWCPLRVESSQVVR
jgi:hypothetical protein